MSIKIYNTLTQKKEPFVPLEEGKVKMYVCGPTVYNYIHIGNARPAIVFDTVRRYLEYRGYEVTYISNFTDVDDKLLKAAKESGTDMFTLADRFIDAYMEDIRALGCKEATVHPRVTENIAEIIAFIQRLIEKGYAYESEGDVYFRTKKFPQYGKLSHQSIEDLKVGARIEVDEKKEDPLDFALWKEAKEGEVYWESPWGKGRPGWHIECSAMAKKYLGETIDIHAGGQDLTFPHHENEIAQTESLTGKPFARYWMHNGYINIDSEKMSKSLGNVILVKDMLKKHDPQVFRFFMLSVHYRHPINYSDELMKDAKAGWDRLKTAYNNMRHQRENVNKESNGQDKWMTEIEHFKNQFIKEMDDDFNTANAITVLFELAKSANVYLREKELSKRVLDHYLATFDELFDVLGLDPKEEQILDEEIEQLIKEREEARKRRDFVTADKIRDQLQKMGIILEDTPQGTRWKRG